MNTHLLNYIVIIIIICLHIGVSAGASLNEPPLPPNYSNWPSIFWRHFLVVTLLNNDRLLVVTVHEVHLYVPFT